MEIIPDYRDMKAGIGCNRLAPGSNRHERIAIMLDTVSLSTAFLVYVGLIAAIVAGMLQRTFRGGGGALALAFFALWLAYAGAFSWLGLLGDPNMRPPGVALLVGPVFAALILIVGVLPAGQRLAATLPVALLIGFQVFRVGVELTITELHHQGLAPQLLTLPGGNVELLVAVSAPIFAWIATRGAVGRRVALGWNVLGLLSLLNVAARAVLSSPGPLNLIHAEVPNVAFGSFPFGLIPGFMAPLAFATHMLTFRALRLAGQSSKTPMNHRAASIATST
jgi:hypothetical protein